MIKPRIQLTLFVDENKSQEIEHIRKEFNLKQYCLIKAHVTLCRDDELEQIEKVLANLTRLNHSAITIQFGQVIRFSGEKGVLLPSVGNNESFYQLRALYYKE